MYICLYVFICVTTGIYMRTYIYHCDLLLQAAAAMKANVAATAYANMYIYACL